MAGTLSHGFGRVGRWLLRELVSIWPVFLFFLVGFLLLILLIKVALEEYSIEVRVLSNAVIGALLAAKAALILDETPLARSLEHYRRIVAIAAKVLFYGVTSLLLLGVERVLEAQHRFHDLHAALGYAFQHDTRWIGWALGISIIFALYFAFLEINDRMGEGELWRLFLESRATGRDSRRPSSINTGRGR